MGLSGAAGATMLAGCFGGGDDDASDLIDGDEYEDILDEVDYNEDYEDEFHQVVPDSANPYNDEFVRNPYHIVGDVDQLFGNEYLSVYNTETDEFVQRLAADWEVDDDLTTTVTISDEYAWSNGTDITANDLVTQLKLDAYMQVGLEDYVDPEDGFYTEGDYTFVIEPNDEFTDLEEGLWMNQWAETILFVSEEQFGQYVERFEDANDDDGVESVQQDLIELELSWNEALYSGPFVYVEANEQYSDQIPNPEHPIAQEWDFYLRTGVYEGEEGLRAGEVDWEHAEPQLEDLPDIYEEPPVSFSGQSFAILFGSQDEYIRDYPEVRQALSYAVDMQNLVDVTSPGTPLDEYGTGIDAGYVENFVDEDVLEAMTNYTPHDTDTATELLEEVGFEQDDGQWFTPDGDEWTINFPVGDWFEDHSQVISNNLSEFGIDMDYYVTEFPTWESEHAQTFEYDMTVHLNYGMAGSYHPYSDLDGAFRHPDRHAIDDLGFFDEEVEVPEVGNSDGEMITMNLDEELDAMRLAQSEEELQDYASELAWAHNYLLPGVSIMPWSEHYWVNAGEWDFDIESDDWLNTNREIHYLLENGLSPR
ncbi:ABC transporter substrate-binding protein [Natronolimnobius sp. AArcel1]|uniref:ABC transporter substrate-binding protein n=1 Tax=Natronolimnobius sp. AArcel1 TaxID=1679093 RepID=UPI001F14AC91|nr:ABC transporter substrate-binding protein [Natronolimnobius sp. AArcel1]